MLKYAIKNSLMYLSFVFLAFTSMNAQTNVSILPMCSSHLKEAHALNIQLNYVISFEDFQHNFEQLRQSEHDFMFVAFIEQKVAGWMHLKVQYRLQDPNALEIVAIVVDKEQRSQGIGSKFIDLSVEQAKKLGLASVILFSHINNTGAHSFYEKLGFINKKTSKYFTKEVL